MFVLLVVVGTVVPERGDGRSIVDGEALFWRLLIFGGHRDTESPCSVNLFVV